jgi:RNA 3'-terminal phosphate cyclase (ATP)
MSRRDTLTVDGSQGEGGGQVVRTALTIAAVTGRELRIERIRARRPQPGLRAQHVTVVRALGALCAAEVHGAELGSQHLRFSPGRPAGGGHLDLDVGTAGATALVAQALLLPMGRGGGSAGIRGGTHGPFAPTSDYLRQVFLPSVTGLGVRAEASAVACGFYPRGGGALRMDVRPATAGAPLSLQDRGKLRSLRATIVTAQLPASVGERGGTAVRRAASDFRLPVEVDLLQADAASPGAAVLLVAESEAAIAGFTALGRIGVPMERVALQAWRQFLSWSRTDAAVDEHLADQLVLPAAFACGTSQWSTPRMTSHLETVLTLVGELVGCRWESAVHGGRAVITVHGEGMGAR